MSDTNPLFQGFQPQTIVPNDRPLKENEFVPTHEIKQETAKQRKAREKKEAAAAAKAAKVAQRGSKTKRKPRAEKPEPSIVRPVEPKIATNLQTLFAAMKGLHEEDHDLFEKLLAASPASRKRVFVAIAKIFP